MPLPLAIHGGTPAFPADGFHWPPQDDAIKAALDDAWAAGDWGRYHGQQSPRLLAALAESQQAAQVTLCSSGTVAVELALRGLGIRTDDEVLLAAYDFAGNFRAIEALGAWPVLLDIDEQWRITPERFEAALSVTTRAVIVSHLHGALANMPEIMRIAAAHGVRVVEDACQAPGAMLAGRPAGSWGDAGVLSFGGSKLLTAGRGGAVVTNDPAVQQRIKVYNDRGNQTFPLSELQAAVLVPQLAQLPERTQIRAANVRRLAARLQAQTALQMVGVPENGDVPAYYKVGFLLRPDALPGVSRDDFIAAAQAEGIPLDAGFRGFARRSRRRCTADDELPNANLAAAQTLVLHHPVLLAGPETIDLLADAILKVVHGLRSS